MHQLAETPTDSSSTNASISLILPAWNEAEVIVHAIEEADEALRELTNCYEIVVVDDGSTDGTAELVEQAMESNGCVRLVRHDRNRGYGAALRNGFAAAKKNLVVFTDSDCQFDLHELDRFILLSQSYDIVCGYRIDRKDTPLRCLYSRCYNHMVRFLLGTGLRDVDCAMKMFHRDVVQNLTISTDGFLVNSELLTQARRKNHSIVEVGVSHRPRTEGQSTVSIHHIPKVLTSLARYWWNSVQFPLSGDTSDSQSKRGTLPKDDKWIGWAQLALVLIAAVFLLSNLGYPLIDRDETRYAEIPREMLATNNWTLPQLNFEPYSDKPPMLYWLCAISYSIFGISEWSARLVPSLAALSTLLATMWFGNRNFGKRIGLLSGTVLLLSVGFIFTSRYLLIDGVLSLLVAMSLFTAYESIRGTKVKLAWWLASAAFCGLAFLTKGPLSLVLLLPPVFAFTWLSESFAKPRLWHYALTFGTVAAIAAPWLIAVSMQDGSFLLDFFYRHNVQRFAGEFHSKPFWYFVPVLLVAGHPWSFLTIPYARFLFTRDEGVHATRPPILGFLLLWSVWCFVFFSLSGCKLPTYLLPAAPALALLIGHYLNHALGDSKERPKFWFATFWSARTATATTCLAGVGFIVFILYIGLEIAFTTYLWGLLWTALLICSVLMLGDHRQSKFAWASSSVMAFLLAVMVMHQLVPAYSRQQTVFGPGSPIAKKFKSVPGQSIVTVSHEFSEVPFYLQRSDIAHLPVADAGQLRDLVADQGDTIVILDRHASLEELRSQLPQDVVMRTGIKRGPATFVHLSLTQPTSRIAETPDRTQDPGQSR